MHRPRHRYQSSAQSRCRSVRPTYQVGATVRQRRQAHVALRRFGGGRLQRRRSKPRDKFILPFALLASLGLRESIILARDLRSSLRVFGAGYFHKLLGVEARIAQNAFRKTPPPADALACFAVLNPCAEASSSL